MRRESKGGLRSAVHARDRRGGWLSGSVNRGPARSHAPETQAVHQRAYTSLRNALPWVHRPNHYALRIIASAPGARLALIFSRQASW